MDGGIAGIFQRASPTGQLQECTPVIFTAPSSSRRAADPIKIGMVAPLTGPFAESGRYQTQGRNSRSTRSMGRLLPEQVLCGAVISGSKVRVLVRPLKIKNLADGRI
jgi:hypothetical protein